MKQKIESSLERGIRRLPHPSFEAIARAHVAPMQAHDYITRQECPPKQRRVWLHALACAAVVLAAGAGWFFQYRMVDAIIDLDVNPSFEITANRSEQVLDVRGLNAQAREVLRGRVYRGWALEDTLDTLFTDLNESGYVSGQQNAVLVSIAGRDLRHTQELKALVTQRITDTLTARDIQPDIIQQDLQTRESVAQPQENGVSDGKLQLIDRLCAQNPTLSREALIPMSITQLRALAQEQGFDLGLAEETPPPPAPVPTVTPPMPTAPALSPAPTLTPAPAPANTPIPVTSAPPVIREDIYDDDDADDEEKDGDDNPDLDEEDGRDFDDRDDADGEQDFDSREDDDHDEQENDNEDDEEDEDDGEDDD